MKFRVPIISLLFIFILNGISAQMRPSGIAPGVVFPPGEKTIRHEFALQVPVNKLMAEDIIGPVDGIPYRIGYAVPIYKDLFQLGQWIKLDDGRLFFRAVLSSPGALGVNVAFEEFYLPDNSQLFYYGQDISTVYGGYNEADNHESRMFPGPLIEGADVVIEYFEPDPSKVTEKPVLFVKDIMHYYRPVFETLKNNTIGNSGICQVNINCVEGNDWQNEKRGIARILVRAGNSAGWCSGTLINNTAQDGTPYFLTAQHCGSEASPSDHNLWQFRFNFERPGCEESGIPINHTITGASLIAISEMAGGSDMRLLKLNFIPPASFQPYYNGWDRTPIPARRGVGIHHPAGDVKKISTFVTTATNVPSPVISGSTMAANSAWNVNFTSTITNHSITEAGSSGSPLFNESKLIIGSLTGGSSSCSNLSGANVYGKFQFQWDQSGSANIRQLRPWLDPIGTEQLTLNGLDLYPIPVVEKINAQIQGDENVAISLFWEKPAYSLTDNWFGYTSSYSGIRQDIPERATLFDFKKTLGIETFYIKRLSHIFWQNQNFPWGVNTRFRFKIYDEDGKTLLFESAETTGVNFQTTNRGVFLNLNREIALTRPFYVAIAPVATSYPSSLTREITTPSRSFFGSPGNWRPLAENGVFYELFTSVFGSDKPSSSKTNTEDSEESEIMLGPGPGQLLDVITTIQSLPTSTEKLISSILYYNIYRNGVFIGKTSNTTDLFYVDNSGLLSGETYSYQISSVFNTNPSDPTWPVSESKLSKAFIITIANANSFNEPDKPVQVYPNPVKNNLTIRFIEPAKNAYIKISSISGTIVFLKGIESESLTSVDVSWLARGIYLVQIVSDGYSYIEKIAVK